MKKILFLLALVACGAAAQNTTAIFDGDSKHYVTWAEGPFSAPKETIAEGSVTLEPYNGLVEIVFLKGSIAEAKFLLREGDTVRFSYNEAGYPIAHSETEPEFDAVYNFPLSVGIPPRSTDIYTYDKYITSRGMPSEFVLNPGLPDIMDNYKARLDKALKKAKMPEEYKKYYTEAFIGPKEMVADDSLVPYYAVRQWLVGHANEMLDKLIHAGKGRVAPGKVKELFDTAAKEDLPPVCKAVVLRELLQSAFQSYESPEAQREYALKYVEMTGDKSMLPDEFTFDTDQVHLEDTEGNNITLAEFVEQHKGSVVYADFWASWCGQCLAAMPAGAKLREERPDVVFLYISIDSSRNAWLGADKRLGLPNSYRILNMQASKFIEELQLRNVPKYIIFDRAGSLVNKAAPGPARIGELLN